MKRLLKLFAISVLFMGSLTGCKKDDGKIHINFDTVISLKTNTIKEQVYDKAHKVKKPVVVIVDENPDSLQVYGWYKDKEYTTQWNFKTDIATESMTLYAKFVSQYEVKYYQGIDENSMGLLATEFVFKGDVVPVREDLPDCYENPENVYVSNLQDNADGTKKGIKGEPVKFGEDIVSAPTDILLSRSKNFYLSPGAIQRRFTPVAANAGSNGSTIGRISVEGEGENQYAAIDFGRISEKETVVDPYILMDNPQIDVTNSKAIEITMKNPGVGTSLSFYWVGKWEVNGQWINGKEFHSFAEDRVFKFVNDGKGGTTPNDLAKGNCYKDANGLTYKTKQNADDQWVTYVLPISEKLSNGVSVWGCAGKITALRIQSSFTKPASFGEHDENIYNCLYIKSIKGVADPNGKTYSFNDDTIKPILDGGDDSKQDLDEAANKQTAVDGFIFPKDNGAIIKDDTLETYTTSKVVKKTDGTYFAAKYVDGQQTIALKPSKDINLDLLTTFEFKFRNFSYVDKLTFIFKVEYMQDISLRSKTVTTTYSMLTRMENSAEGKINMFGTSNYRGKLVELDILFTPIGVDNMLKFEWIKFSDYVPRKVNGFNFNDMYFGGFTPDANVTPEYNALNKATKFNVSQSGGTVTKVVENINTKAFKGFEFNFVNSSEGIGQVKVSITTDGQSDTYTISTPVATKAQSSFVTLNRSGSISNVKIEFVGTGSIFVKSLEWVFLDASLDLSTGEFYNSKIGQKGSAFANYNYDATELGLFTTNNSSAIYARLGAWDYSVNGKKVVNLSLAGKTKILVLYQCRGASGVVTNPYVSFGAAVKADHNDYLTCDAIPNTYITINGVTKKPDVNETNRVPVTADMESDEWNVLEYTIDSFFTRAEYECYLTSFYFQTASVDAKEFYIRGFALI